MLPYNRILKPRARNQRREMTDAEQLLWMHLRRKQIGGVQFYRQKPIGNYIVDFYAPRANIVIEVDGSQHHELRAIKADAERDEFLSRLKLNILRVNNLQVLRETESVLDTIRLAIDKAGEQS
ncbi:MAG: endonuclease domain-containing protein [Gammaproteobacteria bacterium]|nr:endonuclease domain-containing protein [Gammaproteobacteria bacterium]MDH3411475.1 endonuclease domain-containing protein [Gammaproteobacteria bacterium]